MSKTNYYLQSGTVLEGRYQIEEVIGEGGFGITYKGVHKTIGLPVAIKEFFSKDIMIRNTLESNNVQLTWEENEKKFEKEKKRFLKEARVISSFNKEDGIVHIMDYFEANNTVYIVMEYIEGVSLRKYIKQNGPMSVEETVTKMMPVIHTLDKIHGRGVIHRDIGPNNIMVEENGDFRLIDFGSARAFDEIDEKSYSIILTGGYAPPEQYDKEGHLGPWTDVYAVCAVIYYAITGYSPQEGLSRMLYDELEKPSERGVKIKSDTEKILLKGLAVNPKDRIQSMAELGTQLSQQVKIKKENTSNRKNIIIGFGLVALAVIAITVSIIVVFVSSNKKNSNSSSSASATAVVTSAPNQELENYKALKRRFNAAKLKAAENNLKVKADKKAAAEALDQYKEAIEDNDTAMITKYNSEAEKYISNIEAKTDKSKTVSQEKTNNTKTKKGKTNYKIAPKQKIKKYYFDNLLDNDRERYVATCLAINEYYAMKGCNFKTPALQKYFNKQKWYKNQKKNATTLKLHGVEENNVDRLKKDREWYNKNMYGASGNATDFTLNELLNVAEKLTNK